MSAPSISVPLDLSYLYEVSDNDRDFVKEMMETIVKNTPIEVEQIRAAQSKNNWTEVGRLVHKLKPSLLLLNIESLTTHIKELEKKAKNEVDLDQAATELDEMENYCKLITTELQNELTNDSY